MERRGSLTSELTSIRNTAAAPWHDECAFPAIEELIPHRGEMLLVDAIRSIEPSGGWCETRLREDRPYLDQGRFDSFWMVEIMAQSVAAVYAMTKKLQGLDPCMGFVIAIDSYSWTADFDLNAKDLVQTQVTLDYDLNPFGQYSIQCFVDQQEVASAQMKFMVDPNTEVVKCEP